LLSNGRRLTSTPTHDGLTINELTIAHWQWAVEYYRWDKRGGANLKDALRVLKVLYGHTQAHEFGPRALKACRQSMIEKGWARSYVNALANRLRRTFRWAAEEEMLPGSIDQNLKAVAGLQAGRTEVQRRGRAEFSRIVA
jgi:hypothetical protein